MKQLSTIAIKLSMFIITVAGIVSACSISCGCCDHGKAQKAKTAACCTDQVVATSPIPLENTTLDESARDFQDICNNCNCNVLPQQHANAVSSENRSLNSYVMQVCALYGSLFAQDSNVCKIGFLSLTVRSTSLIPLRI